MIFRRDIVLETLLSKQEIKSVLKKNTEKEEDSFLRDFNSSTKVFEGIVEDDYFDINRIIRYKNDLLPIIYGDVLSNSSSKTKVSIKFRLRKMVKIFLIIFYTAVFLLGLPFSYIFRYVLEDEFIFMFPLISVWVLLVFITVFFLEVNYALEILKKILVR